MPQIKKAAGIFFTDGKKVLILKRSDDGNHGKTWCLPGGKAKDGETQAQTAIRETKEETGLKSIPGKIIDTLSNKEHDQMYTGLLYKVSKPFKINLSHEHTDWEWVSFKDLNKRELHPKFKEQLPKYIKSIKRKVSCFSEWKEFRENLS